MNIQVPREPSKNGATLGRLYVDGAIFCDTLEDEIREIEGAPVADWKIDGETAIPAGRYRVTFENSQRFGPNTLTINDVPGFSGIRIHAGNTDKDTHGCLLVGTRNSDRTIGGSVLKLGALKAVATEAIQRGEQIHIEFFTPHD